MNTPNKPNEKEQLEINCFLKARELANQLNIFIEQCKTQNVDLELMLIETKVIIKQKISK